MTLLLYALINIFYKKEIFSILEGLKMDPYFFFFSFSLLVFPFNLINHLPICQIKSLNVLLSPRLSPYKRVLLLPQRNLNQQRAKICVWNIDHILPSSNQVFNICLGVSITFWKQIVLRKIDNDATKTRGKENIALLYYNKREIEGNKKV